jgi:hypothetical protein
MWILPCGEIKLATDGNNLDGQVPYPYETLHTSA